MKKIFRIAAAIIVLALALYLMVTLFFVFLLLAGIGLVYLLVLRFFGKSPMSPMRPARPASKESQDGVIIEHESVTVDVDSVATNEKKGP